MTLVGRLAVGLLAGGTIGAIYFLWLGWTLQGLVDRRHAGLWFVVNLMARLAFALVCLGLLVRWGGWLALLAAAAGFALARVALVRHWMGRTRYRETP